MMYYALYENFLTEEPNDYVGRIVDATIKNRNDLVKDITGPGSILKETECHGVIGDNRVQF